MKDIGDNGVTQEGRRLRTYTVPHHFFFFYTLPDTVVIVVRSLERHRADWEQLWLFVRRALVDCLVWRCVVLHVRAFIVRQVVDWYQAAIARRLFRVFGIVGYNESTCSAALDRYETLGEALANW